MSQIIIEGKDIGLLHFLIANAHCHLIKKSYPFAVDRDTLSFSKELQQKINKARNIENGNVY